MSKINKRSGFVATNTHFTRRVVSEVLNAQQESAVVVEAPPGAGKSTLICSVANALIDRGVPRLPLVAQTNEQADDLVRAFHRRFPEKVIGRITKSTGPSTAVQQLAQSTANVRIGSHVTDTDMHLAQVVVGTARKWEYERAHLATLGVTFQIGLVDEAYQMRSDTLYRIAELFEVLLCVGDPGQLNPFDPLGETTWQGLPYSPIKPAVDVIKSMSRATDSITLPISWRLPYSAADLVSEAFYPQTSFSAGTVTGQRSLGLTPAALRRIPGLNKKALRQVAATGWSYVELDERPTMQNDHEVAQTIAELTSRALQVQATVIDELHPEGRPLTPERIAVITAHNNQVQAVRYHLHRLGINPDSIVVSTANRIQGREYDLTVVWHPLAGRNDATAFHLDAGRMCVMLSRHRHGCIVVGRGGSDRLLDEFPENEPIFLGEPEPAVNGWEANSLVLKHLARHRAA